MLDPKLGRCYTPYECKCIYYYLPINKIWYPTYYIFSEDVKNQSQEICFEGKNVIVGYRSHQTCLVGPSQQYLIKN